MSHTEYDSGLRGLGHEKSHTVHSSVSRFHSRETMFAERAADCSIGTGIIGSVGFEILVLRFIFS